METKIKYCNGVRKIVKVKKRIMPASQNQLEALSKARISANSEDANNKRRKSIAARKEDGLIGLK